MLKRIKLVNFKSFSDQEASLSPLTFLVGANASGKSNLLDAIRFVQGMTLGMSMNEVLHGRWEGGNIVWSGIRGGSKETARLGKKQFGIETDWVISEKNKTYSYYLSCHTGDSVLKEESLKIQQSTIQKSLFSTKVRKNTLALFMAGQRMKAPSDYQSSRSFLKYAAGHASYLTPEDALIFDPISFFCTNTVQAVNQTLFLDLDPSLMRNYAPKQNLELSKQGENISAVLWNLCKDKEKREILMDWLIELCAPELLDIQFDENSLEEVILLLVEKDRTKISARSLSDGTLKFIGLLTALLTAPEQSVLLIEEIENGLHPTRLHLLIELLESAVESRNIQVIATTHSPLALEILSREHLLNSLLFARTSESDGSQIKRLGDLPHLQHVLEKSSMDHLFTTGWLERVL